MSAQCPLCSSRNGEWLIVEKAPVHKYWKCQACELLSMSPLELPDVIREKGRYDFHQNEDNPGYRQFLQPVVTALAKTFSPVQRCELTGLDFGCGPSQIPLLKKMLQEENFYLEVFDPLYHADQELLQHHYDFITCTEVVEHFHQPQKSWQQLASLLKPGAPLLVKTNLQYPHVDFASWSYRRDETHVSFYTPKTMEWLSANLGLDLLSIDGDFIFFKKSDRKVGPRYIGDMI